MYANWRAMDGTEMGKVQARPAPLEHGWKIKRLFKLRASINEKQPLHCALSEGTGHSVALGKSRSWHMELRNDTITSVRQKIQALGAQAMPPPKLNPTQFKEIKESFDQKMAIRRAASMLSTRKHKLAKALLQTHALSWITNGLSLV